MVHAILPVQRGCFLCRKTVAFGVKRPFLRCLDDLLNKLGFWAKIWDVQVSYKGGSCFDNIYYPKNTFRSMVYVTFPVKKG